MGKEKRGLLRKWKRGLALLLGIAVIGAQLPLPAAAAEGNPVSYQTCTVNSDNGLDWDTGTVADYTEVTDSTTAWSNGWYVVNGAVTINTRVTVSGNVSLILTDGCTLTINGGITLEGSNSLTIYGQEAGTGSLKAIGSDQSVTNGAYTGIGGRTEKDGGSLTVYGGSVTAIGGSSTTENGAVGIGGGNRGMMNVGAGGSLTVYGGSVTATGGSSMSGSRVVGIGGGYSGGMNVGADTNINFQGGRITQNGSVTNTSYYIVSVTPGSNMSSDSTLTQKVEIPSNHTAITDIIITASEDYGFPLDYISKISGVTDNKINGLNVTQEEDTKITISGTPGADVNITLSDAAARPEAPSGLKGESPSYVGAADGKLTGVNSTMEYRKEGDTAWTACPSPGTEVTGLAAGTYEVRLKATNSAPAGYAAEVTVGIGPERISVTAPAFDAVTYGDARPSAQTITVKNNADTVTTITGVALSGTNADSFELNKTSGTDISAGGTDSTTYTIQPKAGLNAGTYSATIAVTYQTGTSTGQTGESTRTVEAQVSLTVNKKQLTASMIGDISDQYYTGAAIEPNVIVTDTAGITEDDYEISYLNNTAAGQATVTITGKNNYTGSVTKNFTIQYIDMPEILVNEQRFDSEKWYTSDVTISAGNGTDNVWSVSIDGVTFADTYTVSEEGANTVNLYFKNAAPDKPGFITAKQTMTVQIDRTAPDGDITIQENSIKKFIHEITFGLFYKENVDVKITATDTGSGIRSAEYYRSEKILTEDEVKALTDAQWKKCSNPASCVITETAKNAEQFIYYVRIMDNAGNVTIFGSDGVTFDTKTSVINGIENDRTSPQMGDKSNISFLVFMLISGAAFAGMVVCDKKRRKQIK